MSRNDQFGLGREPLKQDDRLTILEDKIAGPFRFLNPTRAKYQYQHDGSQGTSSSPGTATRSANQKPNVVFNWKSRDNRKGRHALVIKTSDDTTDGLPQPTRHWKHVSRVSWKMLTYYPIWDISWWIAYIFTWGSIVWVFNAFFVFLPDLAPSTTFHDEILTAGGITAFLGATIFEFGSILLMLEAINENRDGCFGWAVEQIYDKHFGHNTGKDVILKIQPDKKNCTHHHGNKRNLVGKPHSCVSRSSPDSDKSTTHSAGNKSWQWWPSMYDLRTHYLRELGFLACSWQMFGATVFWISGFTALPGINNKLSEGLLNGIYWIPQIIGGSGFIISGTLFMIETQKHWWQPAPAVLGWQIGFWNLIGGLGFTLCPCFGLYTSSWAQYQASCSTFWGSWAFLIGSLIQLYESLDKNPVAVNRS